MGRDPDCPGPTVPGDRAVVQHEGMTDAADQTDAGRTAGGPRARRRTGRREAQQPLRAARDILTVRRVFGEPVVAGDVTLVPVARVVGGAGYGYGDGEVLADGDHEGVRAGSGSGGGFGVRVSPVGVYTVHGSEVTWQPTVDMTRVILGGQLLGLVTILLIARALRRRR